MTTTPQTGVDAGETSIQPRVVSQGAHPGVHVAPRKPLKLSDVQEALGDDPSVVFALQREMYDPYVVARFTVEGEPESKARARWQSKKGGRPYTPKATRESQERIGWLFRQSVGPYRPNSTSSYGVIAVFFCESGQRRDVDNMLKLVLDGLNKVAWDDDSQVSEVSGRVVRRTPDPRTEVLIYLTGGHPSPTRPCEQCGKPFPAYPSQAGKRRFCDRACGYAYRRAQNRKVCAYCEKEFQSTRADAMYCSTTCGYAARTVTLACLQCGKEFTKPQSIARRSTTPICSEECREVYWRARRQTRARGTCADCGGSTSKRSYTRCRACQIAHQRGVITDLSGKVTR